MVLGSSSKHQQEEDRFAGQEADGCTSQAQGYVAAQCVNSHLIPEGGYCPPTSYPELLLTPGIPFAAIRAFLLLKILKLRLLG